MSNNRRIKPQLSGYDDLGRAVNQIRATRSFPEEQEDIWQKLASSRRATARVMNEPDFTELMTRRVEEVGKWEMEEGYWNQKRAIIDDGVAEKIRQIIRLPRKQNEAAHKGRRVGNPQAQTESKMSPQSSTGQGWRGARNGPAWESASPLNYGNHKDNQGLAILSDRLGPTSPCWGCHSISGFNQWQQPSGID